MGKPSMALQETIELNSKTVDQLSVINKYIKSIKSFFLFYKTCFKQFLRRDRGFRFIYLFKFIIFQKKKSNKDQISGRTRIETGPKRLSVDDPISLTS